MGHLQRYTRPVHGAASFEWIDARVPDFADRSAVARQLDHPQRSSPNSDTQFEDGARLLPTDRPVNGAITGRLGEMGKVEDS